MSLIINNFFLNFLAELFQNLKLKPTKTWTEKFESYLKNIPPYYYGVSNFNLVFCL